MVACDKSIMPRIIPLPNALPLPLRPALAVWLYPPRTDALCVTTRWAPDWTLCTRSSCPRSVASFSLPSKKWPWGYMVIAFVSRGFSLRPKRYKAAGLFFPLLRLYKRRGVTRAWVMVHSNEGKVHSRKGAGWAKEGLPVHFHPKSAGESGLTQITVAFRMSLDPWNIHTWYSFGGGALDRIRTTYVNVGGRIAVLPLLRKWRVGYLLYTHFSALPWLQNVSFLSPAKSSNTSLNVSLWSLMELISTNFFKQLAIREQTKT